MAGPVYSSAGAGVATEASGGNLNVPMPATVNAGDLLVIQSHWEGGTVAPVTPSGWTVTSGPDNQGAFRCFTHSKIADGTEGGTNVSLGSPANTNGRWARAYRFTGVRSDTILNVVGGFAFGIGGVAQIDDTGVTTPEANCLAVNLVNVSDDNAVGSFTGETGGDWTEAVAEYTTSATTPDACLQIQTAAMAAAGTINGGSFTMAAADEWGVTGFYIRGVSGTAQTQNVDDTLSLADANTFERGLTIADTASLADARTFDRGLAAADTVALADAQAFQREIHIDDTASLADSTTVERGLAQAIDDTLSLTDAVALEEDLVIGDTLSLSDVATPDLHVGAIQIDDTITPSDALAFDREIHIDDTAGVADSVTVSRPAITIDDTLTIDDAQALGRDIHIADTVGLADSASTESGKTVQIDDTLALADARTFDRDIHLDDTATPTDALAFQRAIEIDDTVATSDAQAITGSRQITIDDTVATSDALAFDREIHIADTASLADDCEPNVGIILTQAIADAIAVADNVQLEHVFAPSDTGYIDFPGVGLITKPLGTGRIARAVQGTTKGAP